MIDPVNPKLLIEGRPGEGKSIFLKRFAKEMRDIKDQENNFMYKPFIIKLSSINDCEYFWRYALNLDKDFEEKEIYEQII